MWTIIGLFAGRVKRFIIMDAITTSAAGWFMACTDTRDSKIWVCANLVHIWNCPVPMKRCRWVLPMSEGVCVKYNCQKSHDIMVTTTDNSKSWVWKAGLIWSRCCCYHKFIWLRMMHWMVLNKMLKDICIILNTVKCFTTSSQSRSEVICLPMMWNHGVLVVEHTKQQFLNNQKNNS